MGNHAIRLLKANEIECRVSIVKENGISLLLYKDARVDQRILDETFGLFGWKRSHQCIDGNLYCTVAVYDKETGEWVAKQDVGTMGYAEKEKLILSILVDTFFTRIFMSKLQHPEIHNTSVV